MDDDKDNMLYNLFFLMFNLVRIITYIKHKKKNTQKKIVLIKIKYTSIWRLNRLTIIFPTSSTNYKYNLNFRYSYE